MAAIIEEMEENNDEEGYLAFEEALSSVMKELQEEYPGIIHPILSPEPEEETT